jgi:hypothetical protein
MVARSRWWLRALPLCAALACKGKAAPAAIDAAPVGEPAEIIRIENIAVSVPVWLEHAGPEPEPRMVAGRLWESLSQSPDFVAVGVTAGRRPVIDAGPGIAYRAARLKAELGLDQAPADAGKPERLRAVAALSLVWTVDDEEIPPWGAAECDGAIPPRAQLPAAAQALVECALGDAARSLIEKQAVRRGDEAAVLRALDGADPAVRQVAFATVAERQLRAAAPRLLEMLKSDDELVRDGAIGALVALREPRAVKALTELAEFRDLDMMRRIIDAVGAIGGEDARAYLELVAAGHEVSAVRDLATAALSRLNRRSVDASSQ